MREDSWDKPKNDWCWRRGFSAFCKFFNKYPSPAGKPAPSPSWGEGCRLLRRYTPRNDVFNNTHHSALKRHSLLQGAREQGRSMIEMLGVLAIIGVLSVAGIAGYSKAMEKFKVNKAIEEYSYVITGLLEYKDNILKQAPENQHFISDLVLAMQLVPDTWQMGDFLDYGTQKNLQDHFGNGIYFFTQQKELAMHIYMNQANNNLRLNWCQILMENVIKPLHSMINKGGIAWNGNWQFVYSGDKYCSEETNCLRDITLAQISEQCKSCMEKSGACMVGLNF